MIEDMDMLYFCFFVLIMNVLHFNYLFLYFCKMLTMRLLCVKIIYIACNSFGSSIFRKGQIIRH